MDYWCNMCGWYSVLPIEKRSSRSLLQSMQPNELPSLCSTLHLFPHVLPSDFTLSFLSLVQYIHSAAAHVVRSYLLSRLLSPIVQFCYTGAHMVPLHVSVIFFFFLITVLFMLGNDFFFLPHFFQAGYWAYKNLKFCSVPLTMNHFFV